MAKKKQEVALQKELLNDEQWETGLTHNGLLVVDVYQQWCGPCKATVGMFRRIKNELADDLLGFAVAEADNIQALQFYRGKCVPTFMLYAGGKLQAVIKGVNAPKIERSIQEQLAKEHKVQSGDQQRSEYVDPDLEAAMAAEEAAREEALRPKPEPKTCSVMVIKPDAVEEGKTEEILEKLREQGIEIVQNVERHLTEDEARQFYGAHSEEPWFEELIEFMTRGPCHVVLVTKGPTGDDVIPELRGLIGPTDANEAKEEAPESLRAIYGSDKLYNGVHAADSKEQAAQELAFFFPDADLPLCERQEEKPLQRTLALVRPDAYREKGDEVIESIKGSGFKIVMMKEVTLTRDQAGAFYAEHEGEEFFQTLIDNMTSGPLLALALAREDGIAKWRDTLGPKEVAEAAEQAPESLRAKYAVEDVPVNQLHGSDSEEAAQKELDFFFPVQKTLAVIKPNAMSKRDEIMERISEAGFVVSAQKESHLTREMAESFYSEHKDKEFFNSLIDFMTSGDSLFLVLNKEDAIHDLKNLRGSKNPDEDRGSSKNSLRATYGEDTLKNAIHASANEQEAEAEIMQIFETTDFGGALEAAALAAAIGADTEGAGEDAAAPAATEEEEAPKEEGDQPTQESADDKPAEEAEEQKPEEAPQEEQKPAEDAAAAEEPKPAEEQPEQEAETPADGAEEPKQEEEGEKGDEAKPEEAAAEEQKPDEEKPADPEEEKKPEDAPAAS